MYKIEIFELLLKKIYVVNPTEIRLPNIIKNLFKSFLYGSSRIKLLKLLLENQDFFSEKELSETVKD